MNRQVPAKYTIVGDGKVAQHIAHYFQLLNIEFNHWSRQLYPTDFSNNSTSSKSTDKKSTGSAESNIIETKGHPAQKLKAMVKDVDHVLLLISDDAIEPFIRKYRFLQDKSLVHFSGSVLISGVQGCHPLMTFSHEMYDLKLYQSIPFVIEEGVDFKTVFPQLPNSSVSIAKGSKALYHSLCVMAGNFAQTLWRETAQQFENSLGLPQNLLDPYLQQNTLNFIRDPEHSATGPIARGDHKTIDKQLKSLDNNALLEVYRAFLDLQQSPKAMEALSCNKRSGQ